MAAFLAGVSGLTAACPVVVESKQEPEPVLTPLPRGMEKVVMALCRRPGLVMTHPVQKVSIQLRSCLRDNGGFENAPKSGGKITFFSKSHRFRKVPLSIKMLYIHTKTQSERF